MFIWIIGFAFFVAAFFVPELGNTFGLPNFAIFAIAGLVVMMNATKNIYQELKWKKL